MSQMNTGGAASVLELVRQRQGSSPAAPAGSVLELVRRRTGATTAPTAQPPEPLGPPVDAQGPITAAFARYGSISGVQPQQGGFVGPRYPAPGPVLPGVPLDTLGPGQLPPDMATARPDLEYPEPRSVLGELAAGVDRGIGMGLSAFGMGGAGADVRPSPAPEGAGRLRRFAQAGAGMAGEFVPAIVGGVATGGLAAGAGAGGLAASLASGLPMAAGSAGATYDRTGSRGASLASAALTSALAPLQVQGVLGRIPGLSERIAQNVAPKVAAYVARRGAEAGFNGAVNVAQAYIDEEIAQMAGSEAMPVDALGAFAGGAAATAGLGVGMDVAGRGFRGVRAAPEGPLVRRREVGLGDASGVTDADVQRVLEDGIGGKPYIPETAVQPGESGVVAPRDAVAAEQAGVGGEHGSGVPVRPEVQRVGEPGNGLDARGDAPLGALNDGEPVGPQRPANLDDVRGRAVSPAELPQKARAAGVASEADALRSPLDSPQGEQAWAGAHAGDRTSPREPWQMTRAEFDQAGFFQHSILKSDAPEVGPEGFAAGIGPNVVPATSGPPSDIMARRYGTRAGRAVYVVPKESTRDTPNGRKIVDGWRPSAKIVPSRDFQPLHEAAVEQALREGRPVPPEVLADYPDLAAKAGGVKPSRKSYREFYDRAGKDIVDPEDAVKFLGTPDAGPAALTAFGVGGFTEINAAPDSPLARAAAEYVDRLPVAKVKKLHRVVAFETEDARRDFVFEYLGGEGGESVQDRTFTSWTPEDPHGQSLSWHLGRDVAAQFGPHEVYLELVGPKAAKDVSYIYGADTRNTEYLLRRGQKLRVRAIGRDGDAIKVVLEDAGRSDPTAGKPVPPVMPEPATPNVAEGARGVRSPETPPAPPAPQTPETPSFTESAGGKKGVGNEPPKPPSEPPTLSGDDLSEVTQYTSARKAMTERDRESMGLDALDGPERRSWATALKDAQKQKLPGRALADAASVLDRPRALSDTETAGMVIEANKIKVAHENLRRELDAATDEGAKLGLGEQIVRAEQDFDLLTRALRASGTEKGRALAAQKLTLDRDFNLVSVVTRAKEAKGADLAPAERSRFERLTSEIKAKDARIAELEKAHADAIAEGAVKRHQPGRRRTEAERARDVADLTAKAKALLKQGCR